MLASLPEFVEELAIASHRGYLSAALQTVSGSGLPPEFEEFRLYLLYCAVTGLAAIDGLEGPLREEAARGASRFIDVSAHLRVGQTPLLRLAWSDFPDVVSLYFIAAIDDITEAQPSLLPRKQVETALSQYADKVVWSACDLRSVYAFSCLASRFSIEVGSSTRERILAYVHRRRSFDHGYSFEESGEAHAAATFLAVAVLRLWDCAPSLSTRTVAWLAARQADLGHSVGLEGPPG